MLNSIQQNTFDRSTPFLNKVISGEPESEHTESAASGKHGEGERTHSHHQGRAWWADSSVWLLLQIFHSMVWCGRRPCNRYFLTWVLKRAKQWRGRRITSSCCCALHVTFQVVWFLSCLCFPTYPSPTPLLKSYVKNRVKEAV